MWKPGTAKPVDSERKPSAVASSPKSPTRTDAQDSGQKKLSGSTMGMRFMQKQKQKQSTVPQEKDESEQGRDHASLQVDQNGSSVCKIGNMATNSEMYGFQSDLIGRRSFGGFKKSVNSNWQDSLKATNGSIRKGSKQHISDEELLQRYQTYIQGRSEATFDSSSNRKRKNSGGADGIRQGRGKMGRKSH